MLEYLLDKEKINIISNLTLPIKHRKIDTIEELLKNVYNYDFGVFYDKELKIITKNGYELTFNQLVLIFLYLINASSREQIGVVVPKNLPTIFDNELTYLIIKRKNEVEFSDIYFLVADNKIIFPYFDKEENKIFNILKFADLLKRRDIDLDNFINERLQNVC